jgi:aromatic-L-amino-acid decarboxylase
MAVHAIDCSVLYTSRPDVLRSALSLVPENLRTSQDESVVNQMDYASHWAGDFRSLKMWFVMRYFGRERMCEIIRNHIEWAQELAAAIESHPQFEIAAPHPFSLVCFRFKGSDEQNRDLMDRVNAGGVAFLRTPCCMADLRSAGHWERAHDARGCFARLGMSSS